MQRRLGKGLGSLLAEIETSDRTREKSELTVLMSPISSIFPNPEQPRKDFDQTHLDELAASIKEKGVIQPILVEAKPDGTFCIIAGERRYRASKLAGLEEMPVIVRNYDQGETLEIALIENLQREDLNALEESLAFQALMDKFSLTQEQIASRLGKSRSAVANSLRLLKLPKAVKDGLRSSQISPGHARTLLGLNGDDSLLERLYTRIVEEQLSVRETEVLVKHVNAGADIDEPVNSPDDYQSPQLIKDLTRGASVKESQKLSNSVEKRSAEIWDLEEKMIRCLGTKVHIKGDANKGKIEIDYYSIEDLNRLYELIDRS